MSDHFPSAAEHLAPNEIAERAAVCGDCVNARQSLLADISREQEPGGAERNLALAAWASVSFPTLEPQEGVVAAVQAFQMDEREFDPTYDVTEDDPAMIEADIQLLIVQQTAQSRNAKTTGEIAAGVPAKVPAGEGTESVLLADEADLAADQSGLETQRAQLASTRITEQQVDVQEKSKTAELAQLQATFNQLKADGMATTDALAQVIAAVTNPETKQHLNAILSKVALLQTALPDKPEVVDHLLKTSGLNLAAATVASSFSSFMEAAEADEALTEDDRASLRRIIEGGDRQLKTGTDVRNAALATTTDPQTGETVAVHTADNKAKVAPGVFTYTETGKNVVLEISEGNLHRQIDVTGLDGVSIGIVAAIMGLAAMAETNGAGGFIKHVYGVDFDRFAEQGIDPLSLASVRQKLTHLIGTGHDGEILQPDQQRQLLETQMHLVSPNGSLLAWEDDPDGYDQNVQALGLNHAPVLEAFGTYTQLHSGLGDVSRRQVQRHLHQRFPDLLAAPDEGKEGDLAA